MDKKKLFNSLYVYIIHLNKTIILFLYELYLIIIKNIFFFLFFILLLLIIEKETFKIDDKVPFFLCIN